MARRLVDIPIAPAYDAADLERPPPMAKNLTPKTTILDAKQMGRIIRRMAGEIAERHHSDLASLLVAGIRTRGVPFAEKIAAEIERMEGIKVPVGTLDITLYRDDLSTV